MTAVAEISDARVRSRNGKSWCINYGGFAPDDQAKGAAFHQELIDTMTAEARRIGWAGAAFSDYARRSGYVALAIVRGDGWPTLDDLRSFRERQRQAAEAAGKVQQEQGSLL